MVRGGRPETRASTPHAGLFSRAELSPHCACGHRRDGPLARAERSTNRETAQDSSQMLAAAAGAVVVLVLALALARARVRGVCLLALALAGAALAAATRGEEDLTCGECAGERGNDCEEDDAKHDSLRARVGGLGVCGG